MDLNNLILFFVLISFGLFFYRYFLLIQNKYNSKLFLDDELEKPQAFHESPTPVIGGICIFFSFLIVYFHFLLFKNIIFFEYLSFCTVFFILGLSDDLKLNIRAKFRLLVMITLLITLVIFNKFYIENTGITFLNRFLEIDIFALFFVCLCFLFIINGSNLIDGYNGLLGIHTFIILVNLDLHKSYYFCEFLTVFPFVNNLLLNFIILVFPNFKTSKVTFIILVTYHFSVHRLYTEAVMQMIISNIVCNTF